MEDTTISPVEKAHRSLPAALAEDWRPAIILVIAVALLTFVHYHPYPWPNLDQRWRLFFWHGLNFVLLFGLPVLLIKGLFREGLREYGLQLGDWRQSARWLLVLLLGFVPIAAWASRRPEFAAYYPRYRPMLENHWLIFPSMAGWLLYFWAWEFFFRGFLLFGLGRRMGPLAIFVQTVPFVMTHFPKPELESWAAIIAGLILGLMAWRSRSFLGPWLLHWLAATSMDLFVVFCPPCRL